MIVRSLSLSLGVAACNLCVPLMETCYEQEEYFTFCHKFCVDVQHHVESVLVVWNMIWKQIWITCREKYSSQSKFFGQRTSGYGSSSSSSTSIDLNLDCTDVLAAKWSPLIIGNSAVSWLAWHNWRAKTFPWWLRYFLATLISIGDIESFLPKEIDSSWGSAKRLVPWKTNQQ